MNYFREEPPIYFMVFPELRKNVDGKLGKYFQMQTSVIYMYTALQSIVLSWFDQKYR